MKRRKKRRAVILIVSAVLVVLLAAVLAFLKKQGAEPEKQELFLTLTADKITSVRYTTENGETISFFRKNGIWEAEDGVPVNVDQMKVSALASSVTGVKLLDVITDPESFSEFGLENPVHTLSVSDTEGHTWYIETGAVNDTAGVVYCTRNGDGNIYCASNVLLLRLNDSYGEYEPDADSGPVSSAEEMPGAE